MDSKKLLIIVDMQNDFVTGSLGTNEAKKIVPHVVNKVKESRTKGDEILFTRDTHNKNYLNTKEGSYLPIAHCIKNTSGWEIIDELKPYITQIIDKPTFGSKDLISFVETRNFDEIELVGLCSDICVITNALLLKTYFPEKTLIVDSSCCAGATPKSHNAALLTMEMCQIEII